MSIIPTAPRGIKNTDPRKLLFYGPPKIGKSSILANLPNLLHVDLERGCDFLDHTIVESPTLDTLFAIYYEAEAMAKTGKLPYKYIALDTVDTLVALFENQVIVEHNNTLPESQHISNIGDIGYGVGYAKVRDKLNNILKCFENIFQSVLLVGHRKLHTTDDSGLVSPTSLDLQGKTRNQIMAWADAVIYVIRDENGQLIASLHDDGSTEAGCRIQRLAGKKIPFRWDFIFLQGNQPPQELLDIPVEKTSKQRESSTVENSKPRQINTSVPKTDTTFGNNVQT